MIVGRGLGQGAANRGNLVSGGLGRKAGTLYSQVVSGALAYAGALAKVTGRALGGASGCAGTGVFGRWLTQTAAGIVAWLGQVLGLRLKIVSLATLPATALGVKTLAATAVELATLPATAIDLETLPATAIGLETLPATAISVQTLPSAPIALRARPATAIEMETL